MSFTPEVIGTSELTRMLWETDCLTSPDTANTMECRLLSPIGANSKLQIGYNSGLNFIAKGSGTGVIHQDTYNLIGTTSKTTYMYAMTAEINISGGTPFWVSDLTPAMGFMQTNQKITVSAAAVPPGCTSSSSCAVISNCADYASAAGCSPLTQIDPLTRDPHTNAFAATSKSGIEALLMSQDGSFIGGPATTDANGNFSLVIDTSTTPITTEGKYKIMLRIPAAQKAGMPCTSGNDSPAGDCLILLKETIISDDSAVNKVAMPALPLPGGGKAEVGNANCDTAINMKDFNALKAAFNSNSGDVSYKTYADFNGDGAVNMKDFNILKANFGKTFSVDTAGGDPALSFLCPAE